MHNVGYHVIRGHKDVYMILEENSLEKSFKLSYKTVMLRMYAQVQRIHRLMFCHCKRICRQSTIHSHACNESRNMPGNLVFNRDMFLNIPLIANGHAITLRREHLINENLLWENQKRRRYYYLPQQRILKKRWKPCKLDERTSGPYRVLQTHVNVTVTIELRPGVSDRLNIRRSIPYKEWMQILIR